MRDRTSRTFIAVSLCRETVAVAYAKLRAMRTLEELQRDDTTKQTDEDGGGVKEEGAVEMVSDYERQRHARMAENNRILMMTGILEASEFFHPELKLLNPSQLAKELESLFCMRWRILSF